MKDAFDLGIVPLAPKWTVPPKLAGVMTETVQGTMTPRVAGILARMGRLPPSTRVGLDGMFNYALSGAGRRC
jgi:hypothetical protein